MSEYEPVIGLEIHAELKTRTKMFCRSKNDADETRPNVNICPVCMAHPGTLPVINREAVKHVLRVGTALGSKLADYTEFDRKNYFYPDLPKGYQLSQYEYPLVAGGELADIAITRIHLEEDTASSMHDDDTGATLIDYNRAGVPLMELVTEPVISSAEKAGEFARELQLLLRYLGVSEANMEKGEMRVEANVSVRRKGDKEFGTKVEIKNLNSFNAMERAVAYEIRRQTEIIESGGTIVQQTLGWDENKQATFPQRVKEGSADYRYFPDPDLPSLKLSELGYDRGAMQKGMPELPWQRRERYAALGVKPEDAESYVRDQKLGAFFEEVIAGYPKETVLLASNYIANDLVNRMKPAFAKGSLLRNASDGQAGGAKRDIDKRETGLLGEIPISAPFFRNIIDLLAKRSISSRTAKDLLVRSIETGRDPADIAHEADLIQKTDENVLKIAVAEVVKVNEQVVIDYKAGKAAALQFLIGQCMKHLRGAADPEMIKRLLLESIG